MPTPTSCSQTYTEDAIEAAVFASASACASEPCSALSPSSAPALESSSSPACLPRWPPPLERDAHISFLVRALDGLSSSYASLDASRPWLLYWTLHSLDLLGARPVDRFPGVVRFLARCQCPGGGFGGGPGQAPHTAATYAAVLALAIVGGREALGIIDTRGLRALYASLKEVDTGGFRVAPGGEADVRGAYTVLAVASLRRLAPKLFKIIAEFRFDSPPSSSSSTSSSSSYSPAYSTSYSPVGFNTISLVDKLDRFIASFPELLEDEEPVPQVTELTNHYAA
jgi:hypothetical protein